MNDTLRAVSVGLLFGIWAALVCVLVDLNTIMKLLEHIAEVKP